MEPIFRGFSGGFPKREGATGLGALTDWDGGCGGDPSMDLLLLLADPGL